MKKSSIIIMTLIGVMFFEGGYISKSYIEARSKPKISTPIKITPSQVEKTVLPLKTTIEPSRETNIKQHVNQTNDNVLCKIDPECGGGTITMSSSMCSASVCCELKGKGWERKSSDQECISAQKEQAKVLNQIIHEQKPERTAVFFSSLSSVMYCDNDKVELVKDLDSYYVKEQETYVQCTAYPNASLEDCLKLYAPARNKFESITSQYCSYN